jgi:hypothetical protein
VRSKLAVDVFKEWFHLTRQRYIPDALVPVSMPHAGALPDADNRIPKQTTQSYWIDVWVPAEAAPGNYTVDIALRAGSETVTKSVKIAVMSAKVPTDDVMSMDHNSYGSLFLVEQYPKLAAKYGGEFLSSDAMFKIIHAYHRIVYEHRGVFHQLGYGHGGKVAPEFAPALTGTGRNKKIASWDLFDRHYGPLLDGSALEGSRRGAKPIPFVYLPINPEWPASFLWWGEPGYEVEFVNIVSEMERHFREKGWTGTRFELFFNHKKRYKAFPWDGDEVRFLRDNQYFKEYGRLMSKAVPAGTPVKFVYRADSSWAMEQQFKELAGIVNFWVCGSGVLSWNKDAFEQVKKRGDLVWSYGSPPQATRPAIAITEIAMRAWLWGIHGWVHWQTVGVGQDPWFQFDGGGTALIYSGERFGIEGPIPSIRLKIQRNALQDLALADAMAKGAAGEAIRAEIARRFNGSRPADWWMAKPALAAQLPQEWSNSDIDDAMRPAEARLRKIDAESWQRVREYVLERAKEGR